MGVLLLLVGVAVLGFGLFQHLKGKRILSAPFKTTGELAKNPVSPDPKGAMSTEGKVVPPAQPLLSPCTKQPCLAYEVKVERLWEKIETTQDGTKTVKGSDTLDTLKGGAVFGLDDGSGAIRVDVSKGADFDSYKDGFKKELNGRGWASQIQFGELSYDVPVISDSEKYTIGFKATEKYVPVEGSLFVLGKLEGASIVKPGWRAMMASAKGREGLLGSIQKKKKFSFIGGGVAAVLSIPLMVFGPSLSEGAANGESDPNVSFGGFCNSALTGSVKGCKGTVSSAEGQRFSWTVTRKDTYELVATPAKGKKVQLDPNLVLENAAGEELVNADASIGQPVTASIELEPGTYSILVKDISGYTVKGGFSFDLSIAEQHPVVAEPVVAQAPASKKSLAEKVAALKAKKSGAAPVKVVEPKPVAVAAVVAPPADPFAIRAGVASCNLPSNGSCTEYATHEEPNQKGCELFKGDYAKKPCPREHLAGVCAMKSGDLNFIFEGGPMGITRQTAGMMCPSNLGTLALAPEAVEPKQAIAALEPVAVPEAPIAAEPAPMPEVDLAPAPVAAKDVELDISAKTLAGIATEMNEACADTFCEGGYQYIFTNLTCDKTARWCQLDVTALSKSTHQAFVATLPFTPAAKTHSAFDAVLADALASFEKAPKSGRLAATVAAPQKAVAVKTVVAEPLAAKPQPAPVATRTVALAPKPAPKPAPVAAPPAPKAAPVKAVSAPAAAPMRASKNMND
ncbi:MAG: GIDE domain-containing protein [Myxococcaceae bacterium]|nr:GIDE domain-containing protein [Myxococcaceae bacterium]